MAEKNYQITQLQSDGSLLVLHPETTAENVIYTSGQTIKAKVDEVATSASNAKSTADTAQSTANTAKTNAATAQSTANTAKTNAATAQNTADSAAAAAASAQSTADTAISNAAIAKSRADDAYALAEGRAKATAFTTKEAMTTALKNASKADYKVGDNLFIEDTGVPDYWIKKVLSTNTGTYGYYEIAELESQKVDVAGYQTKNITSVTINSKAYTTVESAIGALNTYANSIKSTADTAKSTADTAKSNATAAQSTADSAVTAAAAAQSTADTAASDITKITNGTTKVGKASTADKLATARTISLSGDATGSATFDGSANSAITVALKNTGTPGTYSVVTTDAKGRVTAGGQIIEIGTSGQTTPKDSLAVGGIFFKEI